MKKIYFPASFIITAYGSLLLLIAFFFLMHDDSLHRLQSALPLSFIFRFCTFWLISMMLAVVFFMVNLHMNFFTPAHSHRIITRRIALAALGFAALLMLLAVAAGYFFQL